MAGAPEDPLGTVRAGDGTLAVRAHSTNPEYDDLAWFVIDIGGDILDQVYDPDDVEQLIGTWPIVYQPERDVAQR